MGSRPSPHQLAGAQIPSHLPDWRTPQAQRPGQSLERRASGGDRVRRAAAIVLVALSSLAVITLGWADAQIRALPDPGRASVVGRAIVVYDRNGKELGQRDPEGRYHVALRLSQMGRLAPAATLAAEDRDFYRHGAVNPASLIRAFAVDLSTGKPAQGGSTITQQLVKIELLGSQKTASRKAQELALAYSLEHRYSKDEILEMYLNHVYYGHGAYGIGSAVKTYFGSDKSPADLSPAQAAFLAGLPQAPSGNDPFLHYGNARDRQLYVLRGMVSTGTLTAGQEQKSEQEDISRELKLDLSYRQTRAPHFVNYVLAGLENQLGAATVHQGGLAVYTTLDSELQLAAEQAVAAGVAKLGPSGVNNGMLLAARPATGEIVAWVGSANFSQAEIGGQYDVITSPRQPGSSFKPYVYEAALLSRKFTVDSLVNDSPMSFGGYRPMDYDNRFQGQMCLKTALTRSRNIPAVDVANKVGMPAIIDLAGRMGIHTKLAPSLQTAVGGSEVTMLDHVQGYQVFANNGLKVPLIGVTKLVDRRGDTIFQSTPGQQQGRQQVLSPAEAYLMTYMLKDYQRTWNFPWNRQMAAKTGTTGASLQQPTDAWLMAYNPNVVFGTWVGRTGPDGAGGTISSYGEAVGSTMAAQFVNGLPAPYQGWYQKAPDGLALNRQLGDPLLPGTENLPGCGSSGSSPGGTPGGKKHDSGGGQQSQPAGGEDGGDD